MESQAKPKQEEKDASGPRMNDQIRADFVRLVTDDGHEIVSRMVALERARKLKLDLVEVQRKADPPVAIEAYALALLKSTSKIVKVLHLEFLHLMWRVIYDVSELTLRKGDCKEVRFSGKTEAKDLKMKADMVKRLMDRGYRVKIEDVCFVESGPRVEKRQAYVIVRHIKFGPSKKGSGKKASKVVGVTSSEAATMSPAISPTINPSSHVESPIQLEEESDTAESDLENEDEVLSDEADTPISPSMRMADKNLEDNKALETSSSLENINLSDIMHGPRPVLDSTRTNSVPSSLTEPPPETLNRYRKSEPRNRFMPTTSMDNKGPGATNSLRLGPQFLNQGKQARSDTNSSPSTGRTRQDGTDASVFRNLKLPLHEIPMQEPPRPPSSPRPRGTKQVPADTSVSRNSKPPTNDGPKPEQSHPVPPSSPTSSYGIFSASKATAPGKQGMASEVTGTKKETHLNLQEIPVREASSMRTSHQNPMAAREEVSIRMDKEDGNVQ
ncbi:Translation initiation factor IF3-1, mitochondrial [Vitis vinifera]|uniref:Translation initiation factor IF3-1, mitochondrial n=1 Tax=Vitis vinifera TaxID=29760 RepID=A0A438IJ53_VITVI|nr:Translation initiation factor IF3-1, mitochondrial [Vitis vinifera]